MAKFIHTSDWQLGITRHFLDSGVQERYNQARFDSIRRMADIVKAEDCRFVVVAGDVFESNQVNRRTVARALEALRDIPAPIYLLPGNHDPLNDASVYASQTFLDEKPDNVFVVADAVPITIDEETELVGAPWFSKHPAGNPLHQALDSLAPARDRVRICLAHGEADSLTAFSGSETAIMMRRVEQALADGRIHFLALGDRHSYTRVDASGRVYYSGTPEVTDFVETEPGYVNLVEIDAGTVACRKIRTGSWTFQEWDADELTAPEDVRLLLDGLRGVEAKDRCVVRLNLKGTLDLDSYSVLERELERLHDLFAACDIRDDGLHASACDVARLESRLGGFAAETARELADRIAQNGDDVAARDALLLLLRLSGGDA